MRVRSFVLCIILLLTACAGGSLDSPAEERNTVGVGHRAPPPNSGRHRLQGLDPLRRAGPEVHGGLGTALSCWNARGQSWRGATSAEVLSLSGFADNLSPTERSMAYWGGGSELPFLGSKLGPEADALLFVEGTAAAGLGLHRTGFRSLVGGRWRQDYTHRRFVRWWLPL